MEASRPSDRWPLATAARSDATGARRAAERRRNLIAIGTALVICAVAVGFCLRPSLVLGVKADALRTSLGDHSTAVLASNETPGSRCQAATRSDFVCRLEMGDSDSGVVVVPYTVTASATGCWNATPIGNRSRGGVRQPDLDGCITILDL